MVPVWFVHFSLRQGENDFRSCCFLCFLHDAVDLHEVVLSVNAVTVLFRGKACVLCLSMVSNRYRCYASKYSETSLSNA